jgi:predicted HTH transcriptional regulator
MNIHYIHKLITEGEHQQLDFKFEIADSRKIARTFSAFANTDGGRLLIGVKDNGSISGIRTEEEKFMAEAAAGMYCKPPVPYTVKEWSVERKKVLEIIIGRGGQKPYFALDDEDKWQAYIRLHDKNIVANQVIVRSWQRRSKPEGTYINYGPNERLLLEFLEKNEFITLPKLTRIANISNRRAQNILINFLALDILEAVITEKQVLYRLSPGFGKSEEQQLPK